MSPIEKLKRRLLALKPTKIDIPEPKSVTSKNNIAICVFGERIIPEIKLSDYLRQQDFHIFNKPHDDIWQSLWLTAFEKRNVEVEKDKDFDSCLGVNSKNISLLSSFSSSDFDNIFYFNDGYVDFLGRIGIYPTLFFSSSILMDRASEFCLMKKTLPDTIGHIKIDTEEKKFHFFLKQYNIKTRCINYENRSLFKRTT